MFARKKQFLYISPHFAPNSRVGALRPLKFIRHIENFGWKPVVFCGFDPNSGVDYSLLSSIPYDIKVYRSYNNAPSPIQTRDLNFRIKNQSKALTFNVGLSWWNPEIIPMGGDIFQIPLALKNGRNILKEQACDAIVVNSDPYAAAYVGYRLSVEFNIPLIVDFRDPWSVCELRKPLRPYVTKHAVEYIESKIIKRSSKVILNTMNTLSDYRKKYANSDPYKFSFLYNFNDTGLFDTEKGNNVQDGAPKSLLYMGNFRRFINGKELFEILSILRHRGYTPNQIQLSIYGNFPRESYQLATNFGVLPYLNIQNPVPYGQLLTKMESADLLMLMMNRTQQRLPAKFFDYLCSSKPILAISGNTELNDLVNDNYGKAFDFEQLEQAADIIEQLINNRLELHSKRHNPFTAEQASKQLAGLLDECVINFH